MARQYKRYDKEEVALLVKESVSVADVLRKLGKSPVGGNASNLALMMRRWGIDTSHFTGQAHNKGLPSKNRRCANELLVMGTKLDHRVNAARLRRALTEMGVEYKCNCCGINEWMGKPLALEVDHIDECYWNNTFENLQFLCPNCHTMKGK